MNFRTLGKTNFKITEIGIGTWQVGGKWGSDFDPKLAENILNSAADQGINFIDTADVYSDGESEKAIGRFLKTRSEKFIVATKCGRQINPHVSQGYTVPVLRKYVEDSLRRLKVDTLDLIQLHCPPTEVYYRPEIFELFDQLKLEGKIQNLGISVEKIEEALKGIEYDNVTSVQIIFNMFRQRPAELFFEQAKKKNVGIIARVPLASGLLTGKFSANSTFEKGDHRNFNRNGEMFDKGETFSGVDYATGLEAVSELQEILSTDFTLAAQALRWILMFDAISTVIPGASSPEQIGSNLAAANTPPFDDDKMIKIKDLYQKYFKKTIHHWW
ncbi:aldo/keto reductase [Lacihabitans sp. LS3-19]|uniref:aldo/keto reductase n=1 Tax=Lacihabitans sp. LS3-19 TaxID=2487335 RepID=UPI0020CD9DE2|nr:aldo/keto reductase [Lacihabitans sp. LS3-19]MCP9768738.1 aldo/keto reductase [Lacihabitans sp. LS3-19]